MQGNQPSILAVRLHCGPCMVQIPKLLELTKCRLPCPATAKDELQGVGVMQWPNVQWQLLRSWIC